MRYYQYPGTLLPYPIARVYHDLAQPVRIARTSALVNTVVFPPMPSGLDHTFDKRVVVEGAYG